MLRPLTALLSVLLVLGGLLRLAAKEPPMDDTRAAAFKALQEGNFRDAYDAYRKLALDPANRAVDAAQDIAQAVTCLQQLQRLHEADEFLEAAAAAHPEKYRVLWAVANGYSQIDASGFIIAGKFSRGWHDQGGRYVQASERDRVRELQLYVAAMALIENEPDLNEASLFFQQFASRLLSGREYGEAWKLQKLTDLSVLPDYDEAQRWGWRGGGAGKGAPVDAEDNPIFYSVPETFDAARNDGERWRWCLEQSVRKSPELRLQHDMTFADFLHSQFGVQTLQGMRLPPPVDAAEGEAPADPRTNLWSLPSLADSETIARLATGPRRLALPDEFNPLVLYARIAAAEGSPSLAERAQDQIAQIYEDRMQYVKAADAWRTGVRKFGVGNNNFRQARLDQVVKPWGRFEPAASQPAAGGAELEFRFRNGRKLELDAYAVKLDLLLSDVKAYLKSNPQELDWNKLQFDNVGYRLVEGNETKYRGEKAASWSIDLEPLPEHRDRRTTVATPLQRAGAYLVVAKLDGVHTSRIVVWVNDSAIVRKPVNGRSWYYVADAVAGQPLRNANVEFFGWRLEYRDNGRRHAVLTKNFSETTNADGQVLADPKLLDSEYQWVVVARGPNSRLAFLGFSGVWSPDYGQSRYDQFKTYLITDRPVYRPEQPVEFKFWIRPAKYDLTEEQSRAAAGQTYSVRLTDPQGVEVWTKPFTTDEFGGFAGRHELPENAALGVYSLAIVDHPNIGGGGSFRVEEYKKPEFEVVIDAPAAPVQLGEPIEAKIRARYLFGAPVANAVVKYRVERSIRTQQWFPGGAWDWLYGPGYWWFSSDDVWYPGFRRWGCFRPIPFWWNWNPDPPELVLDAEAEIGPDGELPVHIDTTLALALHGDQDHAYKITAEVVDASRRTIVGQGEILVAREPFRVFTWLDRGHYRVGEAIRAEAQVRTLDGKPVAGTGKFSLYRVTYDEDGTPHEALAQSWDSAPDAEGRAAQAIDASQAGQYRLAYALTDEAGRTREGAALFIIRGQGFNGADFRFTDLEVIPDQREYAPGQQVQLLINTNRLNPTVLLFVRPHEGVYAGPPQVLRIQGRSTVVPVAVVLDDMPNFFVEAVTIADGKVHTAVREIVVPPADRVLNVAVKPSAERYLPGQPAEVDVQLTEPNGEPFRGAVVMSIYDRAVEYISGGSNVPDIREHFWKWRRSHNPNDENSLARTEWNLLRSGETAMSNLGAFGEESADLPQSGATLAKAKRDEPTMYFARNRFAAPPGAPMPAAAAPGDAMEMADGFAAEGRMAGGGGAGGAPELATPTVRTQFADTALWRGDIVTDAQGFARVSLTMPENLTGWKIRTWALGAGTRVGEAATEVVTAKNLLVRLQAPRFFVEKDEVVLSAIVHNDLPGDKNVQVELLLEGDTLELPADQSSSVQVGIASHDEARVDWRVNVVREGVARITMRALTDEESDAMQMEFPVYVHGMLKTESFSGVVPAGAESGKVTIRVPDDRRPEQTRLEVRYSPTLAGAMVDALPYLVDYPYGCTEQTLNRFLPTVITQGILKRMNLDLEDIRDKRANLNPQEIGDDAARAAEWKRLTQHGREEHNPVFDAAEVERMVKQGVADLTSMQLSDGGWGWFSGWGEQSWPHTTCVVVHGLQLAQQNGVALVPEVLPRGVAWLQRYQDEQVQLLLKGEQIEQQQRKPEPNERYRTQADNLDAFVYMVLVDADVANAEMQRFLYRDRTKLSLYGAALLGLALDKQQQVEQRDMVIRNIDQFVKVDPENQTAYIDLPDHGSYWWWWYGDVIEANAQFLKLLTRVNPQDPRAQGLVKYLLNNRRHATYWNSTRDTATCIEALAEYLVASGEAEPRMLVEVWLDGALQQSVEITPETLFSFNNSFVIAGDALPTGEHTLELRARPLQEGQAGVRGPLYFNAYLSNFTLEDHITAAGLEIKVDRKFYKLVQRENATDLVEGGRGQAIDQKSLKYDRVEIPGLAEMTSGDLIEVELEIESKNDYEYVIFEDLKAAGCEPVDIQSGYTRDGLGAYVEFRDERVAFFVRRLERGRHSMSYRVRAEIPGRFSALPTRASAMYAPELKANSDEFKLQIVDAP